MFCRTPTATPDHTQKANSNPPYALQQGYSSPAFRPRRLAQNSPATGFQSGTYSPHGAVAASEQSLKAAAELAEMLQRHQPWRDSDTVAVAEPQKAPARDAMADAVAR